MIRTTLATLAALATLAVLLLAAGTLPRGTAFSLAYGDLLDSRLAGGGRLLFNVDLTPSGLAALLEEAPLLVRGPDAGPSLDPAEATHSPFATLPGLPAYATPVHRGAVASADDLQSQLPEPGSLALLGLGILGLFGLRRPA